MKDCFLKAYVKAQVLRDDHGQDLIEYALIAAVLSLMAITALPGLASSINGVWTTIAAKLPIVAAGG